MIPLVRELAADGFPVAVTCEVLGIARSTYYEKRRRAPSARAVADADLSVTIAAVHQRSRGTYGAPRVHAELRLGMGVAIGRKRVARLMRTAELRPTSRLFTPPPSPRHDHHTRTVRETGASSPVTSAYSSADTKLGPGD